MKKTMSGMVAILLASASSQAVAQSGTPVAQPPAAPTDSATQPPHLEEIVVTAQRRSENLQNVPISVAAFSAEKLQATGVQSTVALSQITPALTLNVSVGFVEPKLRGIGNTSAGPGVENSVATYVDGVYISSAPGSLLSLNNVDRVEVLKGPQGTLFGRNATGGLIQIITKDPKDSFGGHADVSYGNYNTFHSDLYVTGPVTRGVDADLAVSYGHQGDGFLYDPIRNSDLGRTPRDLSLRSKWLLDLGATTKARVSFDYQNLITSDPTLELIPGTQSQYITAPLNYDPNKQTLLDGGHNRELKAGGTSLKLDHDFTWATLSSTSAYRRTHFYAAFDADGGPLPAIFRQYNQEDEQVSQELQLTSRNSSKLRWVAGFYYYHLSSGYAPFTDYHAAPLAISTTTMIINTRTQSFAGYAQATYEVLPQTNITAGFRWTEETRSIDGSLATLPVNTGNPLSPNQLAPLAARNLKTNTPTARFSIDHKFDSTLIYFSYNRGFKSGGFNAQSPTAPAYQPEYLDAYEIGVKSDLLSRRLRLNIAAFDYEYQNLQVNTFVGVSPIIYNGASARIYGLDGDFTLLIDNHLTLTGGLTLLHDRFTSFPNAVVTIVRANGSTTTGPGSATGNRLPFAPDAVASLGFQYKQEIAGGDAVLAVSDQHSTGYYGQPDNFLHQNAYDTLNGTLSFRPGHSKLSAQLYATNMLNKRPAVFLSSATTGQQFAVGVPRQFGIKLGVDF